MLTIHHLNMSQSERIVWLCEELGIEYELKRYERVPGLGMAPPAYKALHPTGSSPIIQDASLILAESGAIIEYIVRKHAAGRLIPGPDEPGFADYLYWFHYANGSMMANGLVEIALRLVPPDESDPGFMTTGVKMRIEPAGAEHPSIKAILRRIDIGYDMAERRLSEAPWFAGEAFTAADIMMTFPFSTLRRVSPRDLGSYPALRAYLARIGERPAYRRAMSICEPDVPPVLD